jgi:tetratricopeptide (TPR) repeat protein
VAPDDDDFARAATAISSPGGSGDAGLTDTLPNKLTVGTTGPNGEAPEIPRGTEIGRYVVLDPLGSGAMGVVVSAIDPTLDRKVAIKLVKADRGGTTVGKQRLLREAQAMARLSHPNVVTVYEAGTFGERVYLAMEYIAGTTLAGWLATPHSVKEIIEAFVAAGRGLAAAHRAGIVHRDFKPANVLVARDGRVRVADFGLATAPELRAQTSPPPIELQPDLGMTATGAILGTPTYMAPEQHRGLVASAKADQFAFCVALWEALRGELPFEGTEYAVYAENVLAGRVRNTGKALPAKVEKALRRGLAVEPDARFPSMEVLLDELAQDSARRSVMIGAIVGALVIGGGAAAWLLHEGDPCGAVAGGAAWTPTARETVRMAFLRSGRPTAESAFARVADVLDNREQTQRTARHDACVATEVRHEQSAELLDRRMQCLDARAVETRALIGVLSDHPGVTVIGKAVSAVLDLQPLKMCNDRDALLAGVPAPPPALRPQVAALEREIDRFHALIMTGKRGEADELATQLSRMAEAVPYPAARAHLHKTTALLRDVEGRFDAEVTELRQAGELASEAHDDTLVANSWIVLYHVLGYSLARLAEAHQLEPVATAAIQRAGNPLDLRAFMDMARGGIAIREEEFAKSIALYRRALQEATEAHGPKDPMIAVAEGNLGEGLEAAGNYAEALAANEQSLALRRELFGEASIAVSDSYYQLGALRDTMEKPALALEAFEKSLAIRLKVLAPDDPQCAEVYMSIGVVLNEVGRSKEALASHLRAVALFEANPEDGRAKLGPALSNLGDTYRELERFDEAIATYTRALATQHEVFGETDNLETANVMQNLALAYERKGDDKSAVANWEKALTARKRILGKNHPQVAMSIGALAQNDADHGRHQEAIDRLTLAIPMVKDLPLGPLMVELRGEEHLELHQLDAALADTTHARDALREMNTPPAYATAQFGHARVQWALGHKAEAVAEAKAAVATLEKLPTRNPDEEDILKTAHTWLQARR